MATAIATLSVAKKKSRAPEQTLKSVKLAADVVESARIISAITDEGMSDMLSNILRPILFRLEKEAQEKRAKRKPPAN
jgi:hypothetical protein